MGRVFPTSAYNVRSPGWIELRGAADFASACIALAAQCLPAAEPIAAPSIARWAAMVGEWLMARLAGHAGPWRLHLYCLAGADGASATPARCRYIERALNDLLRKKQRRLLRGQVSDPSAPLMPEEWLLQVGLYSSTAGYLSAVSPADWPSWCRRVSRFPAGTVAIPPDCRAPSRALAKLAEVETRLARPIAAGEQCVDLGSSPGSWSYWALRRGASVVAVDRSPLRADLMRHAGLTFVRGDAFRYRPTRTIDWLLCDVIAFPAKTIELARRWLEEGWCRYFCLTIKFRGQNDYGQLESLKTWLSARGHDFYLRRLTANKNEVMLYGHTAATADIVRGGL